MGFVELMSVPEPSGAYACEHGRPLNRICGRCIEIIPVTLTNRYAKFQADPELQAELKKFFRYRADDATLDNSPAYASGTWDGYINFMRWSRVASGLFLLQRAKIERKLGCTLQITDERVFPRFCPDNTPTRAWGHQKRALAAMVGASNGGGLVIGATGTGKTEIAGMYFKQLMGTGVFIVDELFLLEQSQKAIANVLQEEVGVVGRGEFNPRRITVATIQTLDRHSEDPRFQSWFKSIDVMMLDEIHVALNKRSLGVVGATKAKAVFGLTATLQMQDISVRTRAIELAGPPIFRYGIVQGQEDGILQKGTVFQIPFYIVDATGDYVLDVVCSPERNFLIERVVREGLKSDRIIAVLVERHRHLDRLHQRFRNVEHEVISGKVNKKGERARIIELMRERKLKLLLGSRVFFKGVDIPQLDMIVDATGRPDENGAVQRFGRGVRRAESKRDLVYVDIGDYYYGKPSVATRSRLDAWEKIGIPVRLLEIGELPDCA